jgi:hypothetical protein
MEASLKTKRKWGESRDACGFLATVTGLDHTIRCAESLRWKGLESRMTLPKSNQMQEGERPGRFRRRHGFGPIWEYDGFLLKVSFF